MEKGWIGYGYRSYIIGQSMGAYFQFHWVYKKKLYETYT